MAIDRKEIYGKVTASLIEMMREGVAPWSKPWIAFPASNGSTGKAYRGINRLSLGLAMETNGWSDPRFVTFKQCKAMGGRIIKDSKGSTIVYNKVMEVEDPKTGEVETKWLFRYSTVFNVAQTEGIEWEPLIPEPDFAHDDAHDDAQHLVHSWLTGEGIDFAHGGDRAYYSPGRDAIQMPAKESFVTVEHYYQTLLHEIVHSSGHEKRLKRIDQDTFGSDAYAKEELVAEIGAAMLYATVGLDRDMMEHSAAYLKAWADRLEEDPGILALAANAAERAADYVLERVPEPVC
jgi:antirestriction protein ArdC